MTERTSNGDLAVQLAEIKSELRHIKDILGDDPTKGFQ